MLKLCLIGLPLVALWYLTLYVPHQGRKQEMSPLLAFANIVPICLAVVILVTIGNCILGR
jgi:hypothetical protein